MNLHTGEAPLTGSVQASAGALSGLKVIDMSRVVAGPLAAQTLADLGADVIKVERRGEGDDLRTLGPPWAGDPAQAQSTYFQAVNRGKRSLSLDFTKAEGGALLKQLILGADVLIENFRPGTLARYGLGYEQLARENPRLIYCSITGFGQTGPYAAQSGYDYLAQAMGGQMAANGPADGAPGAGPMRVGVPIADIASGSNAVIAVSAALYHREKSGLGQHIDIALYDSQIALLMNSLSAWINARQRLPKTGNEHPTAVPNGVFECADGFLLVSTFNDREFARLAAALGQPDWPGDPRFEKSRGRLAHRAELVAAMNAIFRGGTRAEWTQRLHEAKIACGPINEMPDIENDPQAAARGMIADLSHPRLGTVRVAGSPLKMSRTPARLVQAAPLPGEHNDEILKQRLGLSAEEIARLAGDGVI